MTRAPRRAASRTEEVHKSRDLTEAQKDTVQHSRPQKRPKRAAWFQGYDSCPRGAREVLLLSLPGEERASGTQTPAGRGAAKMTSLGKRCRQPAAALAPPTVQLTSSLERRRALGGLISEAQILRESPEWEPRPHHTRQAFLCLWRRGGLEPRFTQYAHPGPQVTCQAEIVSQGRGLHLCKLERMPAGV